MFILGIEFETHEEDILILIILKSYRWKYQMMMIVERKSYDIVYCPKNNMMIGHWDLPFYMSKNIPINYIIFLWW